MKKLKEFRGKLEEIFEIDKANLDFGIYRIINQKRIEINKFLENIEEDINKELKDIGNININDKKQELEKLKKIIEDTGLMPEDSPKYMLLKNEIEKNIDISSIENDIYSHLTNFFSRYYNEGDFISQRRYKNGVYAMPYEGEEIKFYWANSDQYYIKTSENFNNYTVNIAEGKKITFLVLEADTESNNNKENIGKERRFFLNEKNPIVISEDEIIIKFEYGINSQKQEKLNNQTNEEVLKLLGKENLNFYNILSKEKLNNEEKSYKTKINILEYELNNYTAKNTFDYFIHKDLGGFLRRELDFYIKNEVMFLDDIDEDRIKNSISKIRAIKKIGNKIIQMLEQIENFQKRLWEKKKFVVETNYCITLDKIIENFQEKEQNVIFEEILSNEEQIKEWKKMYDFDVKGKNIKELKENCNLVIDTKHFVDEFKEKIISSFDNIEEQLNGLLIHSENYQALNLLQQKYREKIDCVYIDPPYNTNSSPILYKNNYKDSSWLSLMYDRNFLSKTLAKKDCLFINAIDEAEYQNLLLMNNIIYRKENYIGTITVKCNPQGRVSNKLNQTSEFNIVFSKDINEIGKLQMDKIDNFTEKTPFKRTGTNSKREERPLRYYPMLIKNEKIFMITEEEYEQIYDKKMKLFNDKFVENLIDEYTKKGYQVILPKKEDGTMLVWQREFSRAKKEFQSYIAQNATIYTPGFEKEIPKTLWESPKFANPEYGTEILKHILMNTAEEDVAKNTPKSFYTVEQFLNLNCSQVILDYFSGSGTTAHAVINLNRKDEGNRKYILAEMGEYFDTVTKPRIKKVIYSKEWQNGKPISREGISQIFKYIKLEQYEDTLNNLVINKPKSLFDNKEFEEDYMLNYMMNFETKDSPSLLNVDMFDNPFDYKMKIIEKNEIKSKKIDLLETFNYLIGLEVRKIEKTRHFQLENEKLIEKFSNNESEYSIKKVIGETRDGDKVLIIWRNRTEDRARDNIAIEKYFESNNTQTDDIKFDRVYINGDNTLQNIRDWKVDLIEEKFLKMMFDEKTL